MAKKLKKYDVRLTTTIRMYIAATSAEEAEARAKEAYDNLSTAEVVDVPWLGEAEFVELGFADGPEARLKW